mmetsp:Transcript_54545/g.157738  ORF Transcript_54545/g.157738 Transcript_54545/m.157738 type:complete len:596 (+) Transcript_54545:1-1788(+)
MGTAYLWLGAFGKAEAHFGKALELEEGLDIDERRAVKEDLARIQDAKNALVLKEKADSAAERVPLGCEREKEALESALELYDAASAADPNCAVIYANRSFARLRAGRSEACIDDGKAALEKLKEWPTARRAPKRPVLAARLDPPFLDDPTFKHPDEVKQGEVDWLMKHGGGNWKDLPSLPPEYEWVKDVAEKQDNAWIAIRKKMPKVTIDAIRRATSKLQDVLYSRNPRVIRAHLEVAIEENKAGEGPSNKALRQSEEYAEKLEVHEKEREAEREEERTEAIREIEDFDLDEAVAAVRSGVAQTGFGHGHPVERTRRRLFVKVLLRSARAHEAIGDREAALSDLRRVLRAEPENPEAKRRLASLVAPEPTPAAAPSPEALAPAAEANLGQAMPLAPTASTTQGEAGHSGPRSLGPGDDSAHPSVSSTAGEKRERRRGPPADEGDEDEEEKSTDHNSISQLVSAAAEYMRKNDYEGALQVYSYVQSRAKVWDSPLTELRVLSNRALCLQRIRGRLPELIAACNEALRRIAELRRDGGEGITEEMLLRMQSACLSRRGNAYMQQRKTEEGNRDLAEVRQVLAQIEELSARERPPPAG